MILTALDIATSTGVCIGEVGKRPLLETWNLRDGGLSRPQRLRCLMEALFKHMSTFGAHTVVYEAPVPLSFMMKMGASEDTIAMLRGAIGVVEAVCSPNVEALPAPKARHSVLGWYVNKSGKNTKRMVVAGVRALGFDPQDDNQADAYVLWAYKSALLNPRLAVNYTPLFRGDNG